MNKIITFFTRIIKYYFIKLFAPSFDENSKQRNGRPHTPLDGEKFNKIRIVKRHPFNRWGSSQWWCICDCGKVFIGVGTNITRGNTKSCGCLLKNHVVKLNKSRRTK